jgi:hypothetical protein
MTKQESIAVGCKLLGVYFAVSHVGTLLMSAAEAFTTFRTLNGGNVPTEYYSMRTLSLVQSLGMLVIGCLLIWQTDWCVSLIMVNDRKSRDEH